MKILHLPLWAPNKNDVQLGNFIQHHISLSARKHEVHSLEFIAAEDCNEIVLLEKEKVSQISYPKSSFKIINFFRYLRAAELAVNHLKKIGFYPDIVHCHVAGRNLWMANKYFPTVPKVISEHWSGYINGNFKNSNYFVKKFMIHQMNRCDAVTSVSEHLKTSLLEHGIDSNVTLLNNVIKYKEKSMVSASGDMIFLMVADLLDEVKNVSGAIEAINQLTHDYSCFKLMIIGDGPDMVFLRKQVERNNLESKIHFLGRLIQDDVQDYLLQVR